MAESQATKFVSPIPSEGKLMDYKYNMLEKKWDAWVSDSVELIPQGINPEICSNEVIVPSNDFVVVYFLLQHLCQVGRV